MIKPNGDNVILKEVTEEEKAGSLYRADNREKPLKGEVLAVGEGGWQSGVRLPVYCKVGDLVYFRANDALPIVIEGKDYYIVHDSAILGKNNKGEENE